MLQASEQLNTNNGKSKAMVAFSYRKPQKIQIEYSASLVITSSQYKDLPPPLRRTTQPDQPTQEPQFFKKQMYAALLL